MIKRGMLNSRMKDFYDIWALSQQFTFNCTALINAIQATFNQRGTTLEATPECFSEAFIADPTKNSQWQSFIRKTALSSAPISLNAVISEIKKFLGPILIYPNEDRLNLNWHPLHASWST